MSEILLTKTKAIDFIKDSGANLWTLELHKNRKEKCVVASQKLEEMEGEESVSLLQDKIEFFPENAKFTLTFKGGKFSNKGTVFTIDFVNSDNQIQPNSQTGGLSGIPHTQYPIHAAYGAGFQGLQGDYERIQRKAEDLDDKRFALVSERAELQIQKNQLEYDRKNFEEKKKEAIEEIKALQRKYESNSEAAKNGFSLLATELIGALAKNGKGLGILGVLNGAPENDGNNHENDPKYKLIEDFATFLYEQDLPIEILAESLTFLRAKFEELINKNNA